jgi:putative ABC transport system ATP-binding protein
MIRGPSGGGKTTMLNLIGTIDSSTSGELHIMN